MANLSNFFAFEAAARHESFTLASEELGMTQSAVSQKVRALEEYFGRPLFVRAGRRVKLSRAGNELFRDVGFAFQTIEKSVDSLSANDRASPVTLSASTAFASWWMAPRLGQFQADCPDIDLRLQTSDRDVDIIEEGISLGIRCGNGRAEGCESTLLCAEVIFPVCSPGWLESHPAPIQPADLLRQRLIHLEEPIRPAATWEDWFDANAVPTTSPLSGLRINDYALVLQAALQGQGFALGWRHLVQPLLDRGLLCRPVAREMKTPMGFYIIQARIRPRDDPADRVRRWMLEQVSADRRRPNEFAQYLGNQ